MSELYEKMYATVVGEVDDTLQIICQAIVDQECTLEKLNEVGEKLRNALLTAEDMYLTAEEPQPQARRRASTSSGISSSFREA